jgi:DNA-binding XRE family transcriptional regulator
LSRLHFSQQTIEAFEAGLPELPIALKIFCCFSEWSGVETSRTSLGVNTTGDQSRAFEDLQVF